MTGYRKREATTWSIQHDLAPFLAFLLPSSFEVNLLWTATLTPCPIAPIGHLPPG